LQKKLDLGVAHERPIAASRLSMTRPQQSEQHSPPFQGGVFATSKNDVAKPTFFAAVTNSNTPHKSSLQRISSSFAKGFLQRGRAATEGHIFVHRARAASRAILFAAFDESP
jgi:hypothetical protein